MKSILYSIRPNFVTTLRVAMFGPVVWFALNSYINLLLLALTAMILGEFTDGFDGWLARKTKRVTDFGKTYDPMCDTLFHMPIWIIMLDRGWISPLSVILFFMRDMIVAYIRQFLIMRGIVFAARWSGKFKAGTQAAAQISIVTFHIPAIAGLFKDPRLVANLQLTAVWLAVLVTFISLCDYSWDANRKFKAK